MQTIQIIDLLNKIANGEEVPEKIIYDNEIFIYDNESRDYLSNSNRYWLFEDFSISAIINDEVEVIEENKEIEMLNFNSLYGASLDDLQDHINRLDEKYVSKINEIINKINKESE